MATRERHLVLRADGRTAYLQMGGPANYAHLVRFLCDHLLATGFGFDAPTPQPRHGVYHPDLPETTLDDLLSRHQPDRPTLEILFYRAHLLSGNTAAIDALVRAAGAASANVLPVFAHSLKDEGDDAAAARAGGGSVGLPAALQYMAGPDGACVDVLISTMSFAMGGINPDGPTMAGWSVEALERFDVAVLQAVLAGSPRGPRPAGRWPAAPAPPRCTGHSHGYAPRRRRRGDARRDGHVCGGGCLGEGAG
jgi:cobaltochelatase CobN